MPEKRVYEHSVGPYRYEVTDKFRSRKERNIAAASAGLIGGPSGKNARTTTFKGIARAPRIDPVASQYVSDKGRPVVYVKLTPEEIRDKTFRESMAAATVGAGAGAAVGSRLIREKERGKLGINMGNGAFKAVGGTRENVRARGVGPTARRFVGYLARDTGDYLVGRTGSRAGMVVGAAVGSAIGGVHYIRSRDRSKGPQYRAMYQTPAVARRD